MSEKEHTPRWKKLLILLSLLPLLWWPVSLLHDTGYIFNKTERLLMILFPFYALISVALAWYCRNERPEVGPDDNLTRVIIEMTHKRLGATVVMHDERILGIITDGDLRRMLMNTTDIEHVKASQIMTSNPKTIEEDALVVDALHKMRENSITQLPVVKDGKYLGIIHLHDILKEGIF